MELPDFIVVIWVRPHRGYGYMVEIDADLVNDGVLGGIFQSFEGVNHLGHPPRFMPEYPYREFHVSPDQMRAMIRLADDISYTFTEHAFTPMLSGSHYGLRVKRCYQEATISWYGRYEDQDESIRKLHDAVRGLAGA